MAYELLALELPPQAMEKTQQTPKDEAQVPEAVPPRVLHLEEVKQVPLNPLVAPQASLGKVTTLKTLRYFPSLSSVVFFVELTDTTRARRSQQAAPERLLMIVISGGVA